jgi:hypothetical protein
MPAEVAGCGGNAFNIRPAAVRSARSGTGLTITCAPSYSGNIDSNHGVGYFSYSYRLNIFEKLRAIVTSATQPKARAPRQISPITPIN